jgi:site-specific recombinase XerD
LYSERNKTILEARGKGNKDRHIALSEKMAGILKTYIRKYHCGLSSYLFFTKSRGDFSRMSERNVQIMLQEYATKAREKDPSIPGHVHPHALRRARATGLYRSGMPIELVSSLLGHNQIETTRVYAKPSIEQMRQNMEKSIPEEAFRQKPVWTGKETEIKRLLGLK